ncbi:Histidine kinase [Pustulibacterium marinum]|uniref:Histidine kinase n=1 Tax=Pustulibacterium marinum TaxID=1224947 RepID=A0A1I7IZ44_9FLAO|nr:sensor histidine kinase [Pustulibacterium marinum]SFU78223.1 Histidine kinase [Pustulibacterium marinum]
MIAIFKNNRWFIIKFFTVLSILIPISMVTYQILFLGKNSVVFLEGYPTAFSFGVLIYYAIILSVGIGWLAIQLKSLAVLKNEKKKIELLHLQNQVNPHFFFNMLNNLYGIVGKDEAKAKALILKLSDLMRYSIYEGGKHLVNLTDEIDYLENFIALNRIRYHKNVDVKFDINMDGAILKVMPLMFIVLVENAFKHGVENLRENSFVHIKLNSFHGVIDFEIYNNFDTTQKQSNAGIGIKNLKRRLQISYPKKHTFETYQEASTFVAILKIKT